MPTYDEWKAGAAGGTPLNVDRLNEPFNLKSVTYDAANNRLVCVFGRGRAWFGGTQVDQAAPLTVYVNAPAVNTTYYAYLTSTGIVVNTTAAPVDGHLPLASIAVGATKDALTRADRRPGLDALGAWALKVAGEKAGLTNANVFTQPQTFQGGLTDGDSDQDVSFYRAFAMPTDTRSWTVTAWDAVNTDLPTHIDVKDGLTLVATLSFTYNTEGKPTQLVVVAGGRTVTITQTFNNLTQFAGRTKAVV